MPQAAKGDWQLWCAEDATCWSAWRLDGQLLWIPDRIKEFYFEAALSTEDCGVGFGSPTPAQWLPAVEQAGVSKPKAELLHEPWMVEVLPAISHTAHVSPVLAQ